MREFSLNYFISFHFILFYLFFIYLFIYSFIYMYYLTSMNYKEATVSVRVCVGRVIS